MPFFQPKYCFGKLIEGNGAKANDQLSLSNA